MNTPVNFTYQAPVGLRGLRGPGRPSRSRPRPPGGGGCAGSAFVPPGPTPGATAAPRGPRAPGASRPSRSRPAHRPFAFGFSQLTAGCAATENRISQTTEPEASCYLPTSFLKCFPAGSQRPRRATGHGSAYNQTTEPEAKTPCPPPFCFRFIPGW